MKKILGIGNALVDVLSQIEDDNLLQTLGLRKGAMIFVDAEQQQKIEETFKALTVTISAGGSASNTMKGAAMLGMNTAFIGRIGGDEMGKKFRASLENQHVQPLLIVSEEEHTGIATTFISVDGQRTFADNLGASQAICIEDINREMLSNYDTLYVEGYLVQNHELIEGVLKIAKELGMTTCLDLASYNVVENDLDFFNKLIVNYVDIVFANEEESFALTHEQPQDAAKTMSKMCKLAVVKLGSGGACIYTHGKYYSVPGCKVNKVIDTTGAGDTFAAGFLYALSKKEDLETCLAVGNLAASEMIQHVGATLALEYWNKIKQTISEYENLKAGYLDQEDWFGPLD